MCMCLCMCVYVSMHVCVHVYVSMHVCVYVSMHVCVHVCVYACVCVYVSMHVCVHVCVYACVCVQYLTIITCVAHIILLQEVTQDCLIYTCVRLAEHKTKTRSTQLIKTRHVHDHASPPTRCTQSRKCTNALYSVIDGLS